MRNLLVLLTAVLMASVGVAGCISGDDAPAATDDEQVAEEAVATEQFGAITGQALDQSLEPVIGGDISLSKNGEILRNTKTDKAGRYTLNEVAPGSYVLRIAALGYAAGQRQVDVLANQITDASLQVDKLSSIELGLPYIVEDEIGGFLACGAGLALVPVGTPGVESGVNPRASPCGSVDENDAFLFPLGIDQGLQEMVIGMTWKPAGGLFGTELNINVEIDGCGATCEEVETYADVTGPPDILFQLREEDVPVELAFSEINGTKAIQFRIFPGPTQTPNLIYQQSYTIYYELYYNQFAPEDRNPIPDQ